MPRYMFHLDDTEYVAVYANDLDEAMEKAGLKKKAKHEPVEEEGIKDKCLISAITDDILFGS